MRLKYHLPRLAFLVTCLCGLVLIQASAQSFAQWGSLKPGPHAVGFKVTNKYDYSRVTRPKTNYEGKPNAGEAAVPMQISVWYPAKVKSSDSPMMFEEYRYLGLKKESFGPVSEAEKVQTLNNVKMSVKFGTGKDITDAEARAILQTKTAAVRDAEAEKGPFPLIISGLGGPGSSSVLGEYLASHGYVVVTTPSLSKTATQQATTPQIAIETQARNLECLLAFARDLSFADQARVGVIGLNFDGMAGLVFQMRNMIADAVVSLDGWEGANNGAEMLRASPYYDPLRMRVPYLLMKQDNAPNPSLQHNLSVFDAFKYADRYFHIVKDIEHFQYVDNPLTTPMLAAEKRQGTEFVYRTVLHFLNAYVKKDQASLTLLKAPVAERGIPASLIKVEAQHAALRAVPIDEEFEALLGVGLNQTGADAASIAKAIEVFRAAKRENPEVILFQEGTMNLYAFRLSRQNKAQEALALYKLNVEAYPNSINAVNNLGNAYRDLGRKELAIECFEKVLEMIAQDTRLNANEKAQSKNNIQQKINQLKEPK